MLSEKALSDGNFILGWEPQRWESLGRPHKPPPPVGPTGLPACRPTEMPARVEGRTVFAIRGSSLLSGNIRGDHVGTTG